MTDNAELIKKYSYAAMRDLHQDTEKSWLLPDVPLLQLQKFNFCEWLSRLQILCFISNKNIFIVYHLLCLIIIFSETRYFSVSRGPDVLQDSPVQDAPEL